MKIVVDTNIVFSAILWTGDKILMNELKKKGFSKFITAPEFKIRHEK